MDVFGRTDGELGRSNLTCGRTLRQEVRDGEGKGVLAPWGSLGSVSYPFVTLGLGEVSGQAQLGNKSQGLADGQVGEQLIVLSHVSHALPDQLGRAVLPVDPDLA